AGGVPFAGLARTGRLAVGTVRVRRRHLPSRRGCMKYAVIDIGSNSVRLLLWADGRSIYKKIETTRLGGGLSQTGRQSEAAIRRTADAVAAFAREAAREGAEKTAAFATAAVRSAENGRDFVRFVRAECGVDVDVISGEREAALGLAGALGGRDGGIVDVGG